MVFSYFLTLEVQSSLIPSEKHGLVLDTKLRLVSTIIFMLYPSSLLCLGILILYFILLFIYFLSFPLSLFLLLFCSCCRKDQLIIFWLSICPLGVYFLDHRSYTHTRFRSYLRIPSANGWFLPGCVGCIYLSSVRPCNYVHVDLQEFAGDGLRTLALAYKDLDEEYFNQWQQRHHKASTELEDRESKLDQLYEEIEKDLLVGKQRTRVFHKARN